eukprot:gnl/TRDRNA2_/TRDRNA2_169873_c0_seq5.p1 gnl/TRDRNA2_/TRDRNA2_169873_c0~~gnl/TRDRNA2_/TRDRNA2_169873_c0_seq5.p1  ORF type:complete len:223 (+),score=11.29 gnl/TRDRNA2_/TRDRNA2_169873_c0_seq5:51-719(+)
MRVIMRVVLLSSLLQPAAWALRMQARGPQSSIATESNIKPLSNGANVLSLHAAHSSLQTSATTRDFRYHQYKHHNCRRHDDFDNDCDDYIHVSGSTCTYPPNYPHCAASHCNAQHYNCDIWTRVDSSNFTGGLLDANEREAQWYCAELGERCKGFRIFTGSYWATQNKLDKIQFFAGSSYLGPGQSICDANGTWPTEDMLEDRANETHSMDCWLKYYVLPAR